MESEKEKTRVKYTSLLNSKNLTMNGAIMY